MRPYPRAQQPEHTFNTTPTGSIPNALRIPPYSGHAAVVLSTVLINDEKVRLKLTIECLFIYCIIIKVITAKHYTFFIQLILLLSSRNSIKMKYNIMCVEHVIMYSVLSLRTLQSF